MKTPDEIKKGLEHCVKLTMCTGCPYSEDSNCDDELFIDALTYIQQLERERDAAVEDLSSNWKCAICKHKCYPIDECPYYKTCGLAYIHWQWRGVQEEV